MYSMGSNARIVWTFLLCGVLIMVLTAGVLISGTTGIDAADVWRAVTGGETSEVCRVIVRDVRLPMALTALLCGMALSVSGLLFQTTFDNPLAGPSILGVSTGASLGVAVVMLSFGGWLGGGIGYYAGILSGAFVGAAAVLAILLLFSSLVKSNVMLLIIGILIGYLASSAISLLNFFSTQQGVHSYVIWGMGNFGGLTWDRLMIYAALAIAAVLSAMLFIKPLNALLLGKRYAESMGMNVRRVRNSLMTVAGVLAALVTAFCGPIGFLGLVMPHVARMATGTANHGVLLPATAIIGGAGALLCAWLSVVCGGGQIIPVNAVTPVISVPVIIYVILKGRK
ncbi:MAG: iron ABC transporter permease [Bacteroidales bacterium]|nr:iron ABC transporter permease [Bacteroidales bacterium]